jgi:surfeit locus 1 family protein
MPANGKVQVPNNHLQYAITWYSLALGLLIVYFAWHRQNGFLKIN